MSLGTIARALEHPWNKTLSLWGDFQRLPGVEAIESTGFMERAMGIEPIAQAWNLIMTYSLEAVFAFGPINGKPTSAKWSHTPEVKGPENCFGVADHPTRTQRESNKSRCIGKMLATVTNPFGPSA
jgi:hypothetical protein